MGKRLRPRGQDRSAPEGGDGHGCIVDQAVGGHGGHVIINVAGVGCHLRELPCQLRFAWKTC